MTKPTRAVIETITPDRASELLRLNTGNFRRLDSHRVARFAKSLISGKWDFNGESIKVNGSQLLDGQHRLAAIVKSGVPMKTVVVYDVDSDARNVDRGKPRTIAQWLSHAGHKNCSNLAATTRMIVRHELGMWHKPNPQPEDVTDSDIYDFIDANVTRINEALRIATVARKVVAPSLGACIAFCGAGTGPIVNEVSEWFFESLASGESLQEHDAPLHLRNRMLSQTKQTSFTPFMKRSLITIAWNKTVLGEPCTNSSLRLRLSGPGKQQAPKRILAVTDQ